MSPRGRTAFTITELLVVIALIVLLISIILVALGKIGGLTRSVKCSSNQRQIGIALVAYSTDFNGHIFDWRNWGLWLDPTDQSQPIDPAHAKAYWGVMYASYVDGGPDLFHCPEAVRLDPQFSDPEVFEGRLCNCYGINAYGDMYSELPDEFRQEHFGSPDRIALFEKKNNVWVGRSVLSMPHPSKTMFCHDSFETVIDGNGDTLDDWWQDYSEWDERSNEQIKQDEYLRHGGLCNCIWMDGHTSSEAEEDWQQDWYLGHMTYRP